MVAAGNGDSEKKGYNMSRKPTYKELEARIRKLEHTTNSRPENSDQDIIRTLSENFQQLAEEQQDKEKLRAILEMAGAVSHELNNPLQVVSIGIEKLGDTHLEPSRRLELMQLVKNHTQRIIELSSKIQKISQYATKDYVHDKKIFDIDAAANEK